MMGAFYVYAHFRETDGRLFYIGKGSGRRAWQRCSRNRHWKAVVAKHGRRVRIVRTGLSEDEAFRIEALLISARQSSLATYTAGGAGIAGYRHTAQAKAAMSKARTGRKMSAATRKAMSDAIRSRPDLLEIRSAQFRSGNNPSQKSENRLASSTRMKTSNPMANPETREKLRLAMKGRHPTLKTRAKLSAARRGKVRGPAPPQVVAALAAAREARKRPVVTSCGLSFASTADAARATGAGQGNIVNNCTGRAKSAGGYQWRYAHAN